MGNVDTLLMSTNPTIRDFFRLRLYHWPGIDEVLEWVVRKQWSLLNVDLKS